MTKKSNNSKEKFVPFGEILKNFPKTLEDFQKEVESQHSENSETTEAKKGEPQEATIEFEVKFVNLPKKRSKKIVLIS